MTATGVGGGGECETEKENFFPLVHSFGPGSRLSPVNPSGVLSVSRDAVPRECGDGGCQVHWGRGVEAVSEVGSVKA